ncbi:hypothetical protein X975_24890, partial [Stegodyphus mimosarum]
MLATPAPFDGIIVFSDCKSVLEVIQNDKTKTCQGIDILLYLILEEKKSFTFQRISAHVNIEGNEQADSLAKEARTIEPAILSTIFSDVNAVIKLSAHLRSTFSIPELDCTQDVTTTVARLRTEHLRGMKILPDGASVYMECTYCLNKQLDSGHLLTCLAFAAVLFQIDSDWTRDILFMDRVGDLAMVVIHAFGHI